MISTFRSADTKAVLREARTPRDVEAWLDQGDAEAHEIGRTAGQVMAAIQRGFRPFMITTGRGQPLGTAVVDTSDGGVTAQLRGVGFEPQILRRLMNWAERHSLELQPDLTSSTAVRLFSLSHTGVPAGSSSKVSAA